jgi:Arc/MetJ family transcription regulator
VPGVLTVGRCIRARRKERRLTIGDVAKSLSALTEEISALERDERSIDNDLGVTVIRFLDLDRQRLAITDALFSVVRKLRSQPLAGAAHDLLLTGDGRFCEARRASSARSWSDIETIADSMRRILPVPASGKIFSLPFFERLDEIVLPVRDDEYRVEYAVRRLPHGVEARTRVDTASRVFEVAISPEGYRNMTRGFPRMLFTVCHEVGHLVLHRMELTEPSTAGHHPTTRLPWYLTTEWQASAFAIAFIAPTAELLELHDSAGSLSPLDISRRFGCSRDAAEWRLRTIEKRFAKRIARPQDNQIQLPFR